MAIISKEALLEKIRALSGDSTSDDVLALLDDVTDTLDSLDKPDDWEEKYKALDETWRQRYKDRFFNKIEETVTEEPKQDILTYEELFEEKR